MARKNECPYKTGDNKCVHKLAGTSKTKKKRVCIYSDPSKCGMFCEWYEMVNGIKNEEKSILTPITTPLNDTLTPTRPKRCTVCGKVIRQNNKSGLCSYHLKQKSYIKVGKSCNS